jgi:hypothetical protein
MKHDFFDKFPKNPQISSFMNIRLVGTEFFADRRTGAMELIVASRDFVNARKNDNAQIISCTNCGTRNTG